MSLWDVNTDGIVDETDLQLLNNLLLAIPNTNLSWKNADLTNDEVIGAFDLCKLRSLIADWNTPIKEPEYIAFWKTKSGQWQIKNGVSEKTVRFIFNGNAGNRLNLVFGYWDTAANVWVNNDNTKLGWFEFDKNGEAIVEIQVPENAKMFI